MEKSGSKVLLGCFGVVALILYGYFTTGFVLMNMWSWFVVNTFHLQELTFYQSLGVAIFVSFLTHQTNTNKEEFDWTKFIAGIISPWFSLIVAYIIHSLM